MAVSFRTMKMRETSKTANSKRAAGRIARQDAEIAELKAELAGALQRIDKLEQENAWLRDENAQLKQQLAAARKNSSTSSKPRSATDCAVQVFLSLSHMNSRKSELS